MRVSKQRQQRHIAKLQARERSMVGWNQHQGELEKQRLDASCDTLRVMPRGGFHFARSIRGHS
jgi:hypothetical protein